jgi:nucleoside-diphosphate-sugar epimerase
MSIVVTGANGFLGRRVVDMLLRRDGQSKLRLVVRSLADKHVTGDNVEWLQGDLTDRCFAEQAAEGATIVYHLAAGMRGNAPDVIFNTVVGTDYLFAALQKQKVQRVVLVSSFAVYGLTSVEWNHVVSEESPLEMNPQLRDPYTYAKLKQEQLLRKYDLPYVIVRPGVIYGEGGPAISARVGLPIGPVFLSLGGRAWLPLTYVDNCAEAVILAGLKEGIEGQAFNIVDDERLRANQYRRRFSREVRRLHSVSVPYPLLKLLAWGLLKYHKASHGQLPTVLTPYKVAAVWKHCRFDNSKAKDKLGWRPRVDLDTALAGTFKDLALKD